MTYIRWATARSREEFRRYDPSRKPHWAWDFVTFCLQNQRRPSAQYDGPWCVAARHMLKRRKLSGEEPSIAFGNRIRLTWQYIAAAYNLWRKDGVARWTLEARILAGQSDKDIGLREELPAEVVECYHALFFHVRDKLHAKGFISTLLCPPYRTLTGSDVRYVWAFFGYHAGPVVLQAFIDDFKATGMTNYDAVADGSLLLSTPNVPRRWLYRVIRDHLTPLWQSDEQFLRERRRWEYTQALLSDVKRPLFSSGITVTVEDIEAEWQQSQLGDQSHVA